MKITHRIVTQATGNLADILAMDNATIPDVPELNEVLGVLALLGMIVANDPATATDPHASSVLAKCQRICAAFTP
jgi:hypothetical protein